MEINCPDCETEINVPENIHVGQILDCDNCGAEIEVKSTKPFDYELIEDEK